MPLAANLRMCICMYVVYNEEFLALPTMLCVFCAHFLVFISCLQLSLKSLLFPSFSSSVSCLIFYFSRQFPNSNSPWPTFEKEKKKKKKRELNIFCWWILSLVAWVSHYSFAILFYISLEELISYYDYLKIMIKISNVSKN